MIRYIVCPGPIRSETDGDWHFVTGEQLARLYRLPPGTWETLEHPDHWTRYARIVDGRIEHTVKMLTPQYRGTVYERIARELEEERAREVDA